jgi:hypothetical protein
MCSLSSILLAAGQQLCWPSFFAAAWIAGVAAEVLLRLLRAVDAVRCRLRKSWTDPRGCVCR